ncbi:STAS domain-containing protein [Actinoplanes sp. NPDC023714]|uniref:STAS domain-containing protein n=1 Tax=Actinoplanes sp. NPDC023714 TaxID=3154322 RepID=UPI0033FB9483
METPFAVVRRDEGAGVSRLVVTGELDQHTCDDLAARIAGAAARIDATEIVVDLGRVTLLAAAGVRALLQGREAAALTGLGFRVVNATGIVYQVLRISGVSRTLIG